MKKTRCLRRLINDPRICTLLPERMGYRVTAWQGTAYPQYSMAATYLPEMWPEMKMTFTAGSDSRAKEGGLWIARRDIADEPPMRMYESLCAIEKAGVSGLVLENASGNPEVTLDRNADGVLARIETIARSRWDPDFVIAVRVGRLRELGYSMLLRTLNDCVDAGADLLMVAGAIPTDELRKLVCGVPRPLCVDFSFPRQYSPARSSFSLPVLQQIGVAAAVVPPVRTRKRRNLYTLTGDLLFPNTSDLRIRNRRGCGVTNAAHRTRSVVDS